jgi:hypothetical protein
MKYSEMPRDKKKAAIKQALVVSIGAPMHGREQAEEQDTAEQQTEESEGHSHTVTFMDESGNGTTDMSDGHSHAIVSGKVQPANVNGESHTHGLKPSSDSSESSEESEDENEI